MAQRDAVHLLFTHFFVCKRQLPPGAYFLPAFFSPATFSVVFTTLPSITTPLPSMMATRDRPSQFLNESTTSGCTGANTTSAISLAFRPPVSFPIFHTSCVIRTAERPVRTKHTGV